MNELAAVCKIRILAVMKATLSQLNRTPGKVVRPVIRGRKTVVLTQHGKVCAKIVPLPKMFENPRLKLYLTLTSA